MVDFLFCRFGFDNFLLREMIAEVTQFVNSEFEYKQVCFILFCKTQKNYWVKQKYTYTYETYQILIFGFATESVCKQ